MVTKLKPYNPSATELVPAWHVIDAQNKVLGRLATEISTRLMGKDRPGYVPHLLSGDFVVVINASKVKVTGNKAATIVYRRHSQHPGHLKEVPYETVLEKFPERVIEHSVKGMLPKNKLGARMLKRLKVYGGEEHPHSAQLIGSEKRLAAIAAGEAAVPEKKTPVRRRKPKQEEPVAAAPEVETPETTEEQAAEVKAPAKKAPAKKAPAKKPAATKAKSSAGKAADSKTPARSSGSRSSASRPGTSRSSASKASAARSTSKSSSAGAATRRTPTRTSRSSGSRKSGE